MIKRNKTARAAICLSLAFILSFIDVFRLPFGGGVSLESLPLMIMSWLSGPAWGLAGGLAYGLLMLAKPSAMVHPIQFVLDYPLAFSSFFIMGFLGRRAPAAAAWGLSAAAFSARMLMHTLSGANFITSFLKTPPPGSALAYALAYNASYLAPTFVICTALFSAIAPGLERRISP